MARTKYEPKKLSVFTPDDIVFDRNIWVDGFATDIDTVVELYPGKPVYEYQLVAVHTPPERPVGYTRKEIK